MRKELFVIPILFALALALCSCVQPSPPKVDYLNYEIARVTVQGIEVNFFFEVKNPNSLPIDIYKYSYKIFINNQEFLSENRSGFNLAANEKQKITIPVQIRYDRLFGTALSIVERLAKGKDSVDFRIEGNLDAGTLGLSVQTPLNASGTIPLPKDIKL
jgi:LEA14-like dessication related protein